MDSLVQAFEEEEESSPLPENGALEPCLLPRPETALKQDDPALSGIAALQDLLVRAQRSSSEDDLLLSAYYLRCFEREYKFSLRRINAMLVSSGLTPVNHSVLETALGRGYMAMAPDLTGIADVNEYTLTPEGEQAAQQRLGAS